MKHSLKNTPRASCRPPIRGARNYNAGPSSALSFYSRVKIFPGAWILATQVGFRTTGWRTRMRTHMHTLPEIFYVSRGRLTLRVYGRKLAVEKGNIIILPSGVFHSFESKKPAELYYINYITRLDKGYDRFKRKPDARWMFFPRVMIGQSAGNLQPLFEKTLERTRQTTKIMMERSLLRLIKAIMRGFKSPIEISDVKEGGSTVYDRRVAESIRYMRRNVLQDLNLGDMCRNHMGMSLRHFSRLFKRSTGYAPRDFLLQLKMKSAETMLNKKVPAKVVAEKLGYDEIYSFYRVFHKATGHGVLVRQR